MLSIHNQFSASDSVTQLYRLNYIQFCIPCILFQHQRRPNCAGNSWGELPYWCFCQWGPKQNCLSLHLSHWPSYAGGGTGLRLQGGGQGENSTWSHYHLGFVGLKTSIFPSSRQVELPISGTLFSLIHSHPGHGEVAFLPEDNSTLLFYIRYRSAPRILTSICDYSVVLC